MQVMKTNFEGIMVIQPEPIGDNRGWFMESYSYSKLKESGIDINFIQDNQSYSEQKGTIRGLHGQLEPYSQTRLLRCTKGSIILYCVDARSSSKTFKKWFCIELSDRDKKEVLIPKGFLHGYKTITDHVEVQYKVDVDYNPKYRITVAWNDPSIGINWLIDHPILSSKDKDAPLLDDAKLNY